MKRTITSIAVAAIALVGLTACTDSSADPSSPNRVEGSYELEYIQVNEDQIIECLWYAKGAQRGSITCDWNYDSSDYSGEPNRVEGSYELEYIEIDGEVVPCLWYAKGVKRGSHSCDW